MIIFHGDRGAASTRVSDERLIRWIKGKEQRLGAARGRHQSDALVFGVQDDPAVVADGISDHGFDLREIVDREHAFRADVIVTDVEDDRAVSRVVSESAAQDAAPRDLEDRAVDRWFLENHACAGGS